ncbi:hypothetical protein KIW84_043496, partial [Lathyrus oleraceus]
ASNTTKDEASSSSPSILTSKWTNHVFLSFRGEDTRQGFTDHLFASLERRGIKTFKDDHDLKRGEVISIELNKAIEESMFAIIILSPNYASSTWCLDELQKIVECNKSFGQAVFPIFHGVDPSDVRHQRGSFAKAFRKHEEKFRKDRNKIERWIDALREVASYSGWDSKGWHEASLVETIVDHIQKKIIPTLQVCTDNFVGIDSRIKEVYALLGMRLNDVRFIGIWGMGGIGKTTIARLVYEDIRKKFEGTDKIEGIAMNLVQPYEARWNVEAFSKLSQLRLLKLCEIKLPQGFNCFPSSLKVLEWRGCPLKTLPLSNHLDEIVDLKLQHSKIEQLWHGTQFFENLKSINLSFSESLKQSPDVAGVPNLELLVLESCTNLTEIHPSLLSHKKLILLNLKDCKRLKALPCKIEMSSLKVLCLS